MESLFRCTELEVRFSLNMNVLSGGQVPGVLSLRDVLRHWLEHRQVVLVRRSKFRLAEDRASPGGARRLPDRLSQHRRGDPHRPLRGRSQGQADQALQADRGAGRADPQPAPEIAVASSRRSRSRPSTTSSARSGASSSRCSSPRTQQWERIAEEVKATREAYSKKTDARPPPHRLSPMRRPSRSISSRP